jgi:RNA polymerase-binding transcription factor DksA
MSKKKDKKEKAAKKANKPAAKKTVAKKPVKKVTKPVAKKVSPTPKAKTKPTPKAKPAVVKTKIKKAEVKKTVKKEVVNKIVSKKEEIKPKKATPVVSPSKAKKSSKKSKSMDADMDGEELDVDTEILEIDPEAMPIYEDDIEEVVVEEKAKEKDKKPKRRRSRGGRIGMKKSYDSEDFVRKQVIKIDLTKSLIKKPKKEEPTPFINNKDTRTRYNDKELNEFKGIIVDKLNEAKADYDLLKQTLTNTDNHGTDDTSPTFKLLEDGSDMLSKEEVAQLASRQEKYIVSLQNALVRIQNKTYGICRVTGKLIPKERLRSVPHATLSMDAKINQYGN